MQISENQTKQINPEKGTRGIHQKTEILVPSNTENRGTEKHTGSEAQVRTITHDTMTGNWNETHWGPLVAKTTPKT